MLFAEDVCSKKITEDKVNEICKQIATKGAAVKTEWPQGLLIKNCGDNYIWVQDTSPEIKMIMHPVKQRLNNQSLVKQLDENKFALFFEFDKAAKAKAEGVWVDYVWAKPGAEKATPKSSFVKICKLPSGESWLAGSGVWKEDVK
ncbi:MAG: cache domain-containing protein [Bacteriovorax sp.]|nr:cache domain-containing protein [Bacteriovorax sp.]